MVDFFEAFIAAKLKWNQVAMFKTCMTEGPTVKIYVYECLDNEKFFIPTYTVEPRYLQLAYFELPLISK